MRPRTKPLGIKSFAFAKNEIAPHGEACEEAGKSPRKLYKKAGDARALSLGFSEKYEGSGWGAVTFTHPKRDPWLNPDLSKKIGLVDVRHCYFTL